MFEDKNEFDKYIDKVRENLLPNELLPNDINRQAIFDFKKDIIKIKYKNLINKPIFYYRGKYKINALQHVCFYLFENKVINKNEQKKIDYILKIYSKYRKFKTEKGYFNYMAKVDENLMKLAQLISFFLQNHQDIQPLLIVA